ncbi:MAG: flagellar biosynthesis anti-sigma factor FlgM [Desulforegulaceae bacterium]|nr:flagellar biosynthesis anti-sigma factor FlgM [Desulforegulaceae bacterium]
MKIAGSFLKEAINQLKPEKAKTEKLEKTKSEITDKVSIGNSSERKSELESSPIYSPENLKIDRGVESRASKIERLKNEINSGTYNISSGKVAEKILGAHINDLI